MVRIYNKVRIDGVSYTAYLKAFKFFLLHSDKISLSKNFMNNQHLSQLFPINST